MGSLHHVVWPTVKVIHSGAKHTRSVKVDLTLQGTKSVDDRRPEATPLGEGVDLVAGDRSSLLTYVGNGVLIRGSQPKSDVRNPTEDSLPQLGPT
jgi:hypothetical protein